MREYIGKESKAGLGKALKKCVKLCHSFYSMWVTGLNIHSNFSSSSSGLPPSGRLSLSVSTQKTPGKIKHFKAIYHNPQVTQFLLKLLLSMLYMMMLSSSYFF